MRIIRKGINLTAFYVFLTLLVGLSSCKKEDELLFNGEEYENIMQYIQANDNYSSFVSIVKSAKMTDVLSSYNHHIGGSDYTLFLPDNAAVDKFLSLDNGYETLNDLLLDSAYATEIVRFHIVNVEILSTEFPNGALNDKTISNDNLTIVYKVDIDSSIYYAVNGDAKVITPDILKSNGVIHVIDKMLTPIVLTSFEWLEAKGDEYAIFYELMSKTGLGDTLTSFRFDEYGRAIYNTYTMFAESKTLYAENGINSFNELVAAIDPTDDHYTERSNAVNQYARYHILQANLFLDEIETELVSAKKTNDEKEEANQLDRIKVVKNTYGDLPISVDLNSILQFNVGVEVYDSIFSEDGDTILIDYLTPKVEKSNVVTRSGAIHELDHLLYPFLPERAEQNFEFRDEQAISDINDVEGIYQILAEDLDDISLTGAVAIYYSKQADDVEGARNKDYIYYSGDAVSFTYKTPTILAGRYQVKVQLLRGYSFLSTLQVSVDGMKVGVPVDPTEGVIKFVNYSVGVVDFDAFETHTVKLTNLIPGRVYIDRIIFTPLFN